MRNTLNLVGDGDDLDVVADVERTFNIRLSDKDAEKALTVGQLQDLIELKHPESRTQACLSQAAFYRLRNALGSMGIEAQIIPDTPITVLNGLEPHSIHHIWTLLARNSGLTLPPLEVAPRPRFSEGIEKFISVVLYGLLALVVLGFAISFGPGWAFFFFVPATVALGTAVAYACFRMFGNIPKRLHTIGDLAREAAGHSFAKLSAEKNGSSPGDRWFALMAILRGISGHKRSITRDTTFFAKYTKPNA